MRAQVEVLRGGEEGKKLLQCPQPAGILGLSAPLRLPYVLGAHDFSVVEQKLKAKGKLILQKSFIFVHPGSWHVKYVKGGEMIPDTETPRNNAQQNNTICRHSLKVMVEPMTCFTNSYPCE